MPKKININQTKCIGCNTCPLIAPDIFALDEKTFKAFVKNQPDPIPAEIDTAISSCPVGAISVEDSNS